MPFEKFLLLLFNLLSPFSAYLISYAIFDIFPLLFQLSVFIFRIFDRMCLVWYFFRYLFNLLYLFPAYLIRCALFDIFSLLFQVYVLFRHRGGERQNLHTKTGKKEVRQQESNKNRQNLLTKTVVTKKQLYMQACNKNRQNLYTKTVVTKKQVSKHASKKPPKLAHQTGMPYLTLGPCGPTSWPSGTL